MSSSVDMMTAFCFRHLSTKLKAMLAAECLFSVGSGVLILPAGDVPQLKWFILCPFLLSQPLRSGKIPAMVCRPAVIGLAEARVLIRSEKYLRWGDVSIVNINTETKHSQDHLTDNLIENFSVAETGPQVLDELQIGYNAGYTSSARVSRLTATVTSPAAFSPTGRGIFFSGTR